MTLVGRDQAIEWLVWAGVLSWDDVERVEDDLDELVLDSIQFGDDDREVHVLSEDEIGAAIEDEEDIILDELQFGLSSNRYFGPELEPLDIQFSTKVDGGQIMWESSLIEQFFAFND